MRTLFELIFAQLNSVAGKDLFQVLETLKKLWEFSTGTKKLISIKVRKSSILATFLGQNVLRVRKPKDLELICKLERITYMFPILDTNLW